jgi:transcriptional regulator
MVSVEPRSSPRSALTYHVWSSKSVAHLHSRAVIVYIPRSFAEHDLPTLFAFLEEHPLAAVVTSSMPDGLFATHLPLVLDRAAGPMGSLVGHVARANPHSRFLADGPLQALAIFTGPDAYITPEWYRTKVETGRVVPTWNYVAVHAYGTLSLTDDPRLLRDHLETLTRRHEADRARPWHVADAPDDYVVQQMKAVVRIDLPIDRLEGKWKMSQNRSDADITGVIRGLDASDRPDDHAVAAIVSRRRPTG